MSDARERALLPPGLGDVLAPDAGVEADAVERLMGVFAKHGYQRVKPPLIEFEESLLAGKGVAIADQTFRMMDPVSQKMLAIRPDMTLQVARIAETRLKGVARPLRLGYAGQVLRIKGSQMRPERQFGQVGAELIGATAAEADAEVILMALGALEDLGIGHLSVDLGVPALVPAILGANIPEKTAIRLRQALDRKDGAAIKPLKADLGADTVKTLGALFDAIGPVDTAFSVLDGVALSGEAARIRDDLKSVASLLRTARPDVALTVDPLENRGFEYHTGVTFTFFSKGARSELGCGGRYITDSGDGGGEPATGFTLFMDSILRSLPRKEPENCLFLPHGTPLDAARTWHGKGWTTVLGMDDASDVEAEARRLGCTHILGENKPREL